MKNIHYPNQVVFFQLNLKETGDFQKFKIFFQNIHSFSIKKINDLSGFFAEIL